MLAAALWLSGPALAASPACDIAAIDSGAQLEEVLQARAVEAIDLAAQPPTAAREARLAALIAEDAVFMLGWLDVGEEFDGRGPAGARQLAARMTATLFIAPGWDRSFMPVADACAEQQAAIEFIDNRIGRRCRITFTFLNGRIVSGQGWERSFDSGPLTPPKPN